MVVRIRCFGRKGLTMVDVKTAVVAAEKAAKEFYDGKKLQGLELEEVDRTADDQYWLITLGFDDPSERRPRAMEALLNADFHHNRKYKVFKIKADDGSVVSMKIREL